MKIALVECPIFNVRMPKLGPAYLKAVLKKNGHSVDSFDLNIRLFHQVPLDMRKYWTYAFSLLCSSRGIDHGWQDPGSLSHLEFMSESLIDEWAQEIVKSNAQVIGFTVYHTSLDVSVALAKKIKQLDGTRKIIFGGPFVLSYVDVHDDTVADIHNPIHRVLDVIDMVAVGEGEDIMLDVVNRLSSGSSLEGCRGVIVKENGNLIINKLRPLIHDLDALPFPDFSILDEYAYTEKNFLPILASRGCPSRCSFCDYPYMDRYAFRARKASCVAEEMEHQIARYKTDFFHFNDSSITLNVSFLSELCQFLIEKKLPVRWGGSASVNSVLTRDTFEKMKRAGCDYLNFGIESASPKVLRAMNKRFRIKDAEKNIIDSHAAGISVLTNWVVGHPFESSRDFQETLSFIKKNSESIAGIDASICTVKPHTPLYENKDRYGIQLNNLQDWSTKDNRDTYGHRVQRLKLLQEQQPDKFARDRLGGTMDVESALSFGEKKGKDALLSEGTASLRCGNLELLFEEGRGRVYFQGAELTKEHGFYGSIFSGGRWVDSRMAKWTMRIKHHQIIAMGSYLDLPIRQKWVLSLADEETIKLHVRMIVDEPLSADYQDFVLMLSEKYDRWVLKKELELFPSVFSATWREIKRFTKGRFPSLSQAERNKTGGWTSICLQPSVLWLSGRKYLALHMTDDQLKARIMLYRHETLSKGKIMPGEHTFFSGSIKVLNTALP